MRDLAYDLKELWKNNYGDGAAHPNLYYTLLRLWSFDIKSGDFAWLKSRGIGLNLIFFTFSFYATFILMTKIFSRENIIVPLFLAIAFWNSASVSNTIFVRPYALQEMLLLIFALNCFVFYKLNLGNTKCTLKERFVRHKFFFAWFIFATALLCLSHYFSLFFIAFTFLLLAFISRKNIFPLSVVLISSFVLTQIFYRDYFLFFGGYRAKESTDKLLLDNFWQNLEQSFGSGMRILNMYFCNIYGFIVFCAVCAIVLIFGRKYIGFKMPKVAIWANLKALFAYLKFIAKNTLKPYKKIFIILSALATIAYIVAFTLILITKNDIKSASLTLDSIKDSSEANTKFVCTAKIIYPHGILNGCSKTASNLIVESIVWSRAIDSSALHITQIKNRYIDFATTQNLNGDLEQILGDLSKKPQIGELSYRADFTPLLKVILHYYVALILVSFAIVFYCQWGKIAWNESPKSTRESVQDSSADSVQDLANSKHSTFLLGFFIVAAIWFAFVLFVAPYKSLRYVMPIFPFLYFGVIGI